MGTKPAITAEEYLRTSFPGPDREYRDGELKERALPDFLHGETQYLIAALFAALRNKLSLFGCTETRMKLREGLYLIPDFAAFHKQRPNGVPEQPPLVVVEILSPDDRMAAVREKLDAYQEWGVTHVWLVDPHAKLMYTCDPALREVASLEIPELQITVRPGDIFAG